MVPRTNRNCIYAIYSKRVADYFHVKWIPIFCECNLNWWKLNQMQHFYSFSANRIFKCANVPISLAVEYRMMECSWTDIYFVFITSLQFNFQCIENHLKWWHSFSFSQRRRSSIVSLQVLPCSFSHTTAVGFAWLAAAREIERVRGENRC